jgi:hypothetical protein
MSANTNVEKALRTREKSKDDEPKKIDVEKAKRLCRDILADDDAPADMKREAREILAALGEDVEEAEANARHIARAMGPRTMAMDPFLTYQGAVLGGRRR